MFVSFVGCCIAFVYLNQQNVACFCFFLFVLDLGASLSAEGLFC